MKSGKQLVLELVRAAPVIVLGVFIAHPFHQLPVQEQTRASKLELPPLPKGLASYPAIPAQQPQGTPAIRPAKGNLSSDEVQQYLTPLCYVEQRNFTWYSPPTPQAPRGTALTFHTAFQVFQAKTSSLIVIGALNRPAAL